MRARRAFRANRFEAALGLLDDAAIRDDRRAIDLRKRTLDGMLARAKRRLEAGHFDLARKDLARIRQIEPEFPGCEDLRDRVEAESTVARERDDQRKRLEAGFERAFDDGRLSEAREALEALEPLIEPETAKALAKRLEERRMAASKALKSVRESLDRGLKAQARETLERARRLCSDSVTFRERLVGLSAAWAKERFGEVQDALEHGRPLDAAKALAEWWRSDPDSEDLADARDLLLCVADRLADELRGLATAGKFENAFVLACQVPSPVSDVGVLRRLKDCLDRLDVLKRDADSDPRQCLQGYKRLQTETHWSSLDPIVRELEAQAAELDGGLTEARNCLIQGEPEQGKQRLEKLLDRWPGCDEARALLSGLLEDERERGERLKAARQDMRDGKLLDAQRNLLRLLSGGYGADEARSLIRDVERLRAKVSRELSAIEARLEGGAETDELLVALARLKQIQQDSAELDELEARVLSRKARIEREERIRHALERRDSRACLAALREWIAEGGEGGLRAGEKRRLEQVGDEIVSRLRTELSKGDPAFVRELGTGLKTWEEILGVDLDALLVEAGDRVEQARRIATLGLEHLEGKRLSQAEDCLERGRVICPSEPQILRLAHRIRSVEAGRREVTEALDVVDTDRQAAVQKLHELGPTPRPLSSMVFQLKDKIERSGDLESGCLVQVEEAGEFLLFTEDKLRIGNATGKHFPHIPVLAKIRAHHASLERQVSFHGGVKDRVVSSNGANTKLNGSPVKESGLAHGDRILLGDVLPLVYQRPSHRSSSALIRLERGFECRGVSRILWVKQGGKDGRVFIGRGKEVHVRVPATEPELYLYAPGPGRLVVHFDGTGQIDGREFHGDAELSPGSYVTCGAIAFRILPL